MIALVEQRNPRMRRTRVRWPVGSSGATLAADAGGLRGLAEQDCTGWAWEDVQPYFIRLEDDLDYVEGNQLC